MKTKSIIAAVVIALASGSGVSLLAAEAPAPQTTKVKKEAVKAYPLDTCIVSGDKLGEMGKVQVFVYKGREIKLCCKPCKKDFDKDPETYLKKLEGK